MTDVAFNNFSSGEFSPLMEGRTDLPEYYRSCRQMENVISLSQGGAVARPGLKYIASEYTTTQYGSRNVSFVYRKTQAYLIEFSSAAPSVSAGHIRIYKDDVAIATINGDGWTVAQLNKLMFFQTRDKLYIQHENFWTRTLERDADDETSWTFSLASYTKGPFLTENSTTTTITPSATTGSVTLTASAAIFVAYDVGKLYKIRHQVSAQSVSGTFAATGVSSSLTRLGSGSLTITGTWAGVIKLQRTYDGSTWYDLRIYSHAASDDAEVSDSWEEEDSSVEYRLNCTTYTSGTPSYEFKFDNAWQDGIAKVTAYLTTKTLTATVLDAFGGTTAATRWWEGSWGMDNGRPSCGAFFEQRVWPASSTIDPNVIWATQTYKEAGGYGTMLIGANDDDALEYHLQTPRIVWLVDTDALMVGTEQGVWKVGATSETDSVTPTNVHVRQQVSEGCAAIQPLKSGNKILFISRSTKRVYMMSQQDNNTFQSVDLTAMAEHITGSGIRSWAIMHEPYNMVLAVSTNGQAVAGIKTGPETIAWSRLVTDGSFEDVESIPGDTEDLAYFTVARTINGSSVRYKEKLMPFDWGDDQEDAFMVDSGVSFDGGARVDVTSVLVASESTQITATAHGFSDGDYVKFRDMTVSDELNENIFTVADAATNTFTLKDVNGTAYVNGLLFDDSGACTGTVEQVFNTLTVSHLEGESLSVYADGNDIGPLTVASSSISLGGWYNSGCAGLSYDFKLKPQRPELITRAGTMQNQKKKIANIKFRVVKTSTFKAGSNDYDLQDVRPLDVPTDVTSPPALTSGDTEPIVLDSGWTADGDIYIKGTSPNTMTICSIIFDLK